METNKKVSVNVRRGDTVVVITGQDKGKKGKVISVNQDDNTCIVEGVNMIVKHKKARSATQKSAREKRAGNIDISNVQIVCGKCSKATRVAAKIEGDKKSRVCKKCGETLDKKFVKAKAKSKEEETPKADATEKKALKRRETKATAESTVKKAEVKTEEIAE